MLALRSNITAKICPFSSTERSLSISFLIYIKLIYASEHKLKVIIRSDRVLALLGRVNTRTIGGRQYSSSQSGIHSGQSKLLGCEWVAAEYSAT